MQPTLPHSLPDGVVRDRYCRSDVTLDTCVALQLYFQSNRSVIVWADQPKHASPAERGKRLRDLRPGDPVVAFGISETLTTLEIYR